jgi:hypothetical protein
VSEITNYIPISRKLFESFLWLEKREFNRAEAWVDLLRRARFEANSTNLLIQGKMVEIHRGEIPTSLRLMAEWWGWSKNRVDKFLYILEKEGMITKRTAKGAAQTVITICNYDRYNFIIEKSGQQKGQSRDSEGTRSGQSRDKTNKENKSKERITKVIPKKDELSLSDTSPLSKNSDVSIDVKKLIALFNEKTKGVFGTVRLPVSDKRRKMLGARISEHGEKSFWEVVEKALESDFLRGQNSRCWVATFDWLIKPSNYDKVLSNNYKNNRNGTNRNDSKTSSRRTSPEQLMDAITSGFARAEYDKSRRERGNVD